MHFLKYKPVSCLTSLKDLLKQTLLYLMVYHISDGFKMAEEKHNFSNLSLMPDVQNTIFVRNLIPTAAPLFHLEEL